MATLDQQRYRRMTRIFQEICDRPRHEQAALLETSCSDDPQLREEVERLLAQADRPNIDFDAARSELGSLLGQAAAQFDDDVPLPEFIGPYRVVRQIGEGGMGAVYLAEQDHPKRHVAVKVVKGGFGSRDMLRRFEHEIQTLGRLEHPGIARIYAAGTTDHHVPFLVMEYVDGLPVDRFCDERQMTIAQRLELFIAIGEAVQYAHMRGVIHRDLKPSNILVESTREEAEQGASSFRPRVIDFGVAKAMHDASTDAPAAWTQHGEHAGTPMYMSPEQAQSDCGDEDVRSDVYSLGVVLYQLLTGCTPVDAEQFRSASFAERSRLLWEQPLPRPSARICRLSIVDCERAANIAHTRELRSANALAGRLRGELDWIVMKCLRNEKDKRYDSVAALLDDLRRFANDEPVLARPPSALYTARKFAGRNRVAVVGAAAVAVAIALGIVGTTWGLFRALEHAEVAMLESQRASDAEEEASRRAEQLEQVVMFQARQISRLDPRTMGDQIRNSVLEEGRSVYEDMAWKDLEELLHSVDFTTLALRWIEENSYQWALAEIERNFSDAPMVKVRLLSSISTSMRWAGLLQEAETPQVEAVELSTRVLGMDDPLTLAAYAGMARLLFEQGRLDEAEFYMREAMVGRQRVLGEDDPETLKMVTLYGVLLRQMGDFEEAERHQRSALARYQRTLPKNHRLTLFSLANLGSLLLEMGRLDEAAPLLEQSLAGKRGKYGNDNIETILSVADMGLLREAQGRLDDAELLLRDAAERSLRHFGSDHFIALQSQHFLARVVHKQGRFDEAEQLYRRCLEGRRNALGESHPETLKTLNGLAKLLEVNGRAVEAEALRSQPE